MSRYQPPELLAARHQLAGFRCRSGEQTAWLVEVAKQAHGTGTTRVFVVTELDQPHVVAYYAWCMASVAIATTVVRIILFMRAFMGAAASRAITGAARAMQAAAPASRPGCS